MKTKNDPRHQNRIQTVKELFAQSFATQKSKSVLTGKILGKLDDIDPHIKKAAVERPIDKLNKIDLAILRLAVYELLYEDKTPPKVIIDEAVEIAKEFGSESSSAFINGVLGQVMASKNDK